MSEKRDWTKVDVYRQGSTEGALTEKDTLIGRIEKATSYYALLQVEERAENDHRHGKMPTADYLEVHKGVENRVLSMIDDAIKYFDDNALANDLETVKATFKERSKIYTLAKNLVETKRPNRA